MIRSALFRLLFFVLYMCLGSGAMAQHEADLRFVVAPDPSRPDQLADSIRKLVVVENGNFMQWLGFVETLKPESSDMPPDSPKAGRDLWVIISLAIIALGIGMTRATFPVSVGLFVRAYYDNFLLGQLTKEENIFRSWPFFFLYVLCGLSLGLFVYLIYQTGWVQQPFSISGIRTFLLISLLVIVLFTLKIGALRMFGFIFKIKKLVRNYIVVLFLGYFNVALFLLPITFILSLMPYENVKWLLPLVLVIIAMMLIYRMVKVIIDLFNNYRFPKFYLFTYLCTLEIAPVLILIKIVYR